jgi:hypothetical protein
MAKNNNIVHQYFKKEMEGMKILVKVNPLLFEGTEIIISDTGVDMRDLQFDEHIFDDLNEDKFEPCSPLEFNLYLSGLAK